MLVGIDLGTTYSLIGHLNSRKVPTLIPDRTQTDDFRTRSIVTVNARGGLVGRPVEMLLDEDPAMPVADYVKNHIGEEKAIFCDHLGRSLHAETLSALILKKLANDALFHSDEEIEGVVITVPAHYDDRQRKATLAAGQLAGLAVCGLLEEPVAAAAYYGFKESGVEKTLLVYDFGGGTFDAGVLHASPGGLVVLASDGCRNLGGKNIDDVMVDMIANDLKQRMNFDPRNDPATALQLRRQAEKVKIAFSQPGIRQHHAQFILGGRPCSCMLLLSHFTRAIEPILRETITITERCLAASGLKWNQIDQILLVGGSSQIPLVREMLQKASGFPAEKLQSRQSHQAVAYGAALLAPQLSGKTMDCVIPELQRALPHGLGIRTRSSRTGEVKVHEMISPNTVVPCAKKAVFYTSRDEQTRMIFEVVQTSRGGEAISLGHFEFGPLSNPRRGRPTELELAYSVNGLVTVTVKDPENNLQVQRVLGEKEQKYSQGLAEQKSILDSIRLLGT
jgi:molecular chaperone DnaK